YILRVEDVGGLVLDTTDRQAQSVVDLTHGLRVALDEVVVHRDEVNARPGQGVKRNREGRGEGLTFTGLHLGDLAFVECDAADDLDVEMSLSEGPLGRLAGHRERFGQKIVELFALLVTNLQLLEGGPQLLVAERLIFRLELV